MFDFLVRFFLTANNSDFIVEVLETAVPRAKYFYQPFLLYLTKILINPLGAIAVLEELQTIFTFKGLKTVRKYSPYC